MLLRGLTPFFAFSKPGGVSHPLFSLEFQCLPDNSGTVNLNKNTKDFKHKPKSEDLPDLGEECMIVGS